MRTELQPGLFTLGIVLATCWTMQADTISFEASTPIPLTLTSCPTWFFCQPNEGGWTSTLAFQQFDPALGYLQSIDIHLSSEIDARLSATNSGNETASVTGADTIATRFSLGPAFFVLSANLGPFSFDLDAGQSGNRELSRTVSDDFGPITGDYLSQFTGTGTIVEGILADSHSSLVLPPGVVGQIDSYASLTGTVTYTFTTVPPPPVTPEPATFPLALFGCAGCASLMLRSRRRWSKDYR